MPINFHPRAGQILMSDFETSEAGQFALIAKCYMEAALTLSHAPPEKKRVLFRPTLALAGQGLELLVKACVSLNGASPPKSGKKGHDILAIWRLAECANLRCAAHENAVIACEIARQEGNYPDVPSAADAPDLIERYIQDLAELHGAAREYPLRYPTDASRTAPRTPFLVQTLWRTSDDFVKRPNQFKIP